MCIIPSDTMLLVLNVLLLLNVISCIKLVKNVLVVQSVKIHDESSLTPLLE
jgi:hypothetical protein